MLCPTRDRARVRRSDLYEVTCHVLRLPYALGALALCLALTSTAGWAQEGDTEQPQATAAEAAGEPTVTKIMPLGASNTYGMYENLTSPGGYRGPLYDLLTAEGARVDFVGLDSDGDIPNADHNGYPGRSIEWFTRPVNKTAEEDRDVVGPSTAVTPQP
jgi:hypothetical protein